jgi:hypothetical protein
VKTPSQMLVRSHRLVDGQREARVIRVRQVNWHTTARRGAAPCT